MMRRTPGGISLQLWLLALLAWAMRLECRAAEWQPDEPTDQPWRIESFLDDSGLRDRSIFNLDFEKDPSIPRWGTVWFATADGLREYDGYAWRRHGREQGLPSDFVRAVLVTRSGVLWVGTDRGAGVYDGKSFVTRGSEVGLAGQNVRRIIEDADGSIWFCCDSWPDSATRGGLTVYRDGIWTSYGRAHGLPSEYVVNYFRDRQGRQYAATLEGVAEFADGRWGVAFSAPAGMVVNWGSASLAETSGIGLVCSTGREVFIREGDVWRLQGSRLAHQQGILATRDGRLIAVGHVETRRKVFVEWQTNRWVRISGEFRVPDDMVMNVRESPDGSVWAVGMNCLIQWSRRPGQWREYTGLHPPRLVDFDGRVWFSASGNRPSGGTTLVWYRDGKWRPQAGAAEGLVVVRDGAVWGRSGDRMTRWQGNEVTTFSEAETGLRTNRVTRVDQRGRIWVMGSDAGETPAVSVFDGTTWRKQSLPDWREMRLWPVAAPGPDGIWLAADRGPMTDAVLRHFGGTNDSRIAIPRTAIGLFGAGIHADRMGSLWLLGGAGLFRWQLGNSRFWEEIPGLPGRRVVSCVERRDELWFACAGTTGGGNGLARLRNGAWTVYSVENHGELTLAGDGTLIWPGDGRFYSLADEPDALPIAVDLPVDTAAREVVKDKEGNYWVSAGGRVFRFTPDGVPPETRVDGPDRVTVGDAMEAVAEGIERFQPREERSDRRFSWRMNGGAWTVPVGERGRTVATDGLSPGVHRLEVRCVDSGLDGDPTPAELVFDVLPVPIQRRPWFLPVIGGTVAALFGLTVMTIRARWKLAGYAHELEKRVEERTAELTADVARRQLAEIAAKEGQERFAKILHASPTIASITAWADGEIIDVNRCFVETLGYESAEVGGQTALKLGIWVRPEQRAAILADLEKGIPIRNRECLFRAKSGRVHTVLTSVERIEFEGRQALLFVSADITARVGMEQRRSMEHAVARVLAEAQSVTEAIPSVLRAICGAEGWVYAELWDAEPSVERLRRVAVWHGGDARFQEMEREGASLDFESDDGLPGIVWKAAAPVFISDLTRDVRFRRNEAAGRSGLSAGLGFPIRAAGRVTGVLVLLTDRPMGPGQDFEGMMGAIGSQIGQFIARSRMREELQRFVAVSPTVLYVLRVKPTGLEPSWVSSNVMTMTGFRAEECLTLKWWRQNLHPDDSRRVLDSQPSPYELEHQVLEFRFRRANGGYIWIRDEKRLLRNAQGNAVEVVGTWSDVSERVALEARLLQAQKMEAIGLLSGGIAHDFNNILGAILGNAQLARMDIAPDHPAAESLDAIVQATRRAKDVVRQILDFARQGSRELSRIRLGPVVEESVRLLRATLPIEVELVTDIAADLPFVMADATQIQQAILNLGTNAWHALDGKPGRIDVGLSCVAVDEAMRSRHPELREGRYLRLKVQDTGSGMTRATMDRIFVPFFTTKAPGTGTGLGLSVVHGVVKGHGGTILVTSAPGMGSTFEVYFPEAIGGREASRGASRREVPKAKGRNERILLVDDKELIVRSCSRALERLGYRVSAFSDGAAALAEFHEKPKEYDLIITDLNMPGLSGLEIARIVHQIRSDLPVILSSGMVPGEMQRELDTAGIRDVLRKPFTFEELGETVAQALGRKGHDNPNS